MPVPVMYTLASVRARLPRSVATIAVIALLVVALTLVLTLMESVRKTLQSSAHPLNLVVLMKGADSDGSSQIRLEAYQAVRFFEGIVRDADDVPLASPQLVAQPFVETVDGGRENVLVRGVDAQALKVHPKVKIVEGRMLGTGAREVVVGSQVARRYEGAAVGQTMKFGRGTWTVVGVMDSDGASFDTEIWSDVRDLGSDSRQALPFSGIRIRAENEAALSRLAERVRADSRFTLTAVRETEYYAKQSETADVLYVIVGIVGLLAGFGACFGAANAMYASVHARRREIGTLRALGFPRWSILLLLQAEAVALALVGFLVGVAVFVALATALSSLGSGLAYTTDFSTQVVDFAVEPAALWLPLWVAVAVGTFGGLAPSIRAVRQRTTDVLREA